MISHLRWFEYLEGRPDLGPHISTKARKLQYRQDFIDPKSLNNFPYQPRIIEGQWTDIPVYTIEMQEQEAGEKLMEIVDKVDTLLQPEGPANSEIKGKVC